jgi:hypothetical protein
MNHSSTNKAPLSSVQSLGYSERAAIYDNAKRRAQALRREAVSGLIEDVIAWFVRAPSTKHRAGAAQRPCATNAI